MPLIQFEHTHIAGYLVATFTVACWVTDSAQGLIARNRINRKWLLLYGVLCIFAYLYARPFIRVGLGSAKRAYINFSTLYIVWLCSAVFYHLPSLEQLGLDLRADLSMLIVVFLSSLAALTLLAGLHTAVVSLRLLPRRAYLPAASARAAAVRAAGSGAAGIAVGTVGRGGGGGGLVGMGGVPVGQGGPGRGVGGGGGVGGVGSGLRQLWVVLMLNSAIIAVACSNYHSFCGNGTLLVDRGTGAFKAAVCAKWLHPILTSDYPRFASWMLYGEGSAHKLGGGSAAAGTAAGGGGGGGGGSVNPVLAELVLTGGTAGDSGGGVDAIRGNASAAPDVPFAAAAVDANWSSPPSLGGSGVETGDVGADSGGGNGEGGGEGGGVGGFISVDFPLDGRGVEAVPAGAVLSPVLCMWVTLMAVYIANTLAGQPQSVLEDDDGSVWGPGTTASAFTARPPFLRAASAPAFAASAPAGSGRRSRRISRADGGGASAAFRRPPSFRVGGGGGGGGARGGSAADRDGGGGSDRSAAGGEGDAGGGGGGLGREDGSAGGAEGGEVWRKGRTRMLEVKRRISKAAFAGAAARGGAAALALAAARRSLTSLTRLAATTGRLRRAASEYLAASHPYVPAIIHKVRRGMAALEPCHLAAELAEAAGVPPDLARALSHGASLPSLYSTTPAVAGTTSLAPVAPAAAVAAAAAGGTAGGSTFTCASYGTGGAAASFTGGGGGGWAYGSGFGAAGGGGGSGVCAVAGEGGANGGGVGGPPEPGPQPDFLDMVPWYSGTSADLFKTTFDLVVSVKLFLGRFDMRTMQAATAASMADSFNDTPSEGDGFTYEHLDERPQLWLDFIADTGDGGNPTYAVASALAAPALTVTMTKELAEAGAAAAAVAAATGTAASVRQPYGSSLVLPRGDVLVIGGDLAYPNPSRETYQQRLFRPFEDALSPPPHYHAGRLVVHKPDLPPAWGAHEARLPYDLRGLSPRSSRHASAAALRRYPGPTAFAIPGNHDWIDGLETFTREIQHKGWLGGWLLPQEKSYFALRLPSGWWLFGFDLALVQDIDMQQYRYFANVVEQRMAPEDQVILVTHEPLWLLEWFWGRRYGSNLRQLVRGHLRGRARLHLAGDLHFYMRHSWTEAAEAEPEPEPPGCTAPEAPLPPQASVPAASKPPLGPRRGLTEGLSPPTTALGMGIAGSFSGHGGGSAGSWQRSSLPGGSSDDEGGGSLDGTSGASDSGGGGADRPVGHDNSLLSSSEPGSHVSGGAAATGLAHCTPPPRLVLDKDAEGGGGGGEAAVSSRHPARRPCAACLARQLWSRHPHDPEHLVVSGGGGAFLHPTHVFAGARFAAPVDPAAEAAAQLYAAVALPCTCGIYSPGAAMYGGLPGDRLATWSTSSSFVANGPAGLMGPGSGMGHGTMGQLTSGGGFAGAGAGLVAGARAGTHMVGPHRGQGGGFLGYASLGPDGEYVCRACYPSPRTSLQLGRKNLHVFRLRNTRFDVIGGVFYFLLVVSVLPRCNHLAEVLEADTPGKALSLLLAAYLETLAAILGRSYLSAAALALMFLFTLGLATGGGVGATKQHPGAVSGGSDAPQQPASSAAAAMASSPSGGAGPRGRPSSSSSSGSPSAPPDVGGSIVADADAGAGVGAGGSGGAGGAVSAPRPLLAARLGGFGMQLAFAVAHTLTHVSLAIVLLLLLELGVETCIKYERLGAGGPHSLYRWYRAYEEEHFPDPMGLRASLEKWTLGLYPGALQLAMAVFDVPELIAVARTAMCAAGGSLEPISRLQAVSYYTGMLSYYWLLATPAMGFVFGLYLYLSVCCFHVHYDEAFSSLREASCKSFVRLHIGPDGDLRVYTLALDRVPKRWEEDPQWRSTNGGGCPGAVAHEAHFPSRWRPGSWAHEEGEEGGPEVQRGAQRDGGTAARNGSRGGGGGGGGGGGARRSAACAAGGPKLHRAASAAASYEGGGGGGAGGGGGSDVGRVEKSGARKGGFGVRKAGSRWRMVDFVHVPKRQL